MSGRPGSRDRSGSTRRLAVLGGTRTGTRRLIVDEPVLRGWSRVVYALILAVWIPANVTFWSWWVQPAHVGNPWLFAAISLASAYDLTLMPLVFLFFLWHMRRPVAIPAWPGMRVAMVTAIVPSAEAIEVLAQTLAGMVAVHYPHDNWVLDEGGNPEVRELCERLGVHYWSRQGIPAFNQDEWPFQARTKSGNYNSWFSDVGYARYDYIVQLDTDHIPAPEYLDEVLGYFSDPEVAYVALPSVYRNLEDWPARGSSEQSQVFHGPMQMGYYGWAQTPMIIGSHAAYRMSALMRIGGFAPSRAEDHLDTLRFAQSGYRGVFVPKTLAVGLGPHTLTDYLMQEHQWAFSIAQVLFKYGRDKGLLSRRQRLLFLFSELWYSIFSVSYLLLFLLPLISLLTNVPIAHVSFFRFLLYSMPITLVSLAGLGWVYTRGWLKPGTHFLVSWQGILLAVARWPIVLVAITNAAISVLFRGGRFNYLVTPKGKGHRQPSRVLRALAPVIVPAIVPIPVSLGYLLLHRGQPNHVAGYVFFALMSTALFTALLVRAAVHELHLNWSFGRHSLAVAARALPLVGLCAVLVSGLTLSAAANWRQTSAALVDWPARSASNVQVANGTPGLPAPTVSSSPTTAAPTVVSPLPAVQSPLFNPGGTGVTFGAYDPSGTLSGLSGLDHLFIAWSNDTTGGLPVNAIRADYRAGRPVMVSVEPWPIAGISGNDVLGAIAAGRYDPVILAEARTVAALRQPILLRFAHEMDLAGQYPWSAQDPAAYIAAYRHVVDLFRANGATNALWVWSPAGTVQAPEYYPGNSYVDYVGTTVLEYSLWETQIAKVATPRPLSTLIKEKYDLLKGFGKPVIIAEMGIDLPTAEKDARLAEMIRVLPEFPLIRAVVYFNAANPPTTVAAGHPNWTLTPAEIDLLRQQLAASPRIAPR
ncbi:MAG TPA: glycosyltransferase family 2 protein [Thermomicrobiaceae bacterium]|nr:glycosyltransferase family 2 protein [Thermomicrobiaceae bacterium]